MIAFDFASAMRRSELVALQVKDLTKTSEGYRVLIRRSKTDQEGQGQEIVIPRGLRIRPVEAIQAWLRLGHHGSLLLRAVHSLLGNRHPARRWIVDSREPRWDDRLGTRPQTPVYRDGAPL